MIDPSADSASDPQERNVDPDPAVTPELFSEWRSPRFGRSNPERMNNPVWEWLVRSELNAFSAAEKLKGPSAVGAGPGWCFDRVGQSSTLLPDGRVILIAGEHEDFYDPDFYIYNDVVVRRPDGGIDIFGYPQEVFHPTDFHTSTLVGKGIIMIGSLGYPKDRKPGSTQIMVLDLDTFAISRAATSGTSPGWIHEHGATLSEDGSSILIEHGKLDRGGEGGSFVENIDDWRLHLADWRWERLTNRRWQRWEFIRRDRKYNHLYEVRQALWHRKVRAHRKLEQEMEQLTLEYGNRPNLDLLEKLYHPNITHEQIPGKAEDYNVFKIKVDGVIVRYVEETTSVQVTVEGDLPQRTIDVLTSDLLNKLTDLEATPYEQRQL